MSAGSSSMGRRIGATLVATAAIASPTASAADAPGSGFVDRLDSSLQPLRSLDPGDVRAARAADLEIADGSVLVDVYVDSDPAAAAARLRGLGMQVAAIASAPLPVIEGSLPLASISEAAKLSATDAVLPVVAFGTDAGAVQSEGVAAHNIPQAIAASGANGAGVDVGVISDSIDQVAGGVDSSQASGDLPPDPRVVVLDDDTTGVIDEGRAMAEIIYDEAPGLNQLLFSTGTTGAAAKAASIDDLVANGADVIADDIFYLSEPFFQDGVISQAADRAKAAGVPYFASAGNRARQSYEQTYRDSAGQHDFDPGAGFDPRSCFSGTVGTGQFIQVALQWDEAWGAATTNLDLFLTNPTGAILATGTTNNLTTGIPREIATFSNAGAPTQVCVEIDRTAGTRTPFMKWIEFDNATGDTVPEYDTQSDTINPDAASARGALAVAAVRASDPGLDTPEPFSSRGPKTRLFDAAGNRLATPLVLAKPELAAADGVNTTVPGFMPFFGTSAAAPSAAGIAALLRSRQPGLTVDQVYARMTDPANAIECSSSTIVPDPDCGAGFILADRVVPAAATQPPPQTPPPSPTATTEPPADSTPPSPTAALSPPAPDGSNGWYTSDVSVSWSTADPESATLGTSGCEPVTIATDGNRILTCSATSRGGTGSASVAIRRDSTPPAKPRIRGIKKDETYAAEQLPPAKKVKKCRSTDATSGLRSCTVRGYSVKPGRHTLKATATDFAGLKRKAKLTYTVSGTGR